MTQPVDPMKVPAVALDNPIPSSWTDEVIDPPPAPVRMAGLAHVIDLFPDKPEFKACEVVIVKPNSRAPLGRRECAGCGQEIEKDEAGHPAVARVVRPGQKYGGLTGATGLVYIEIALLDKTAEMATMSLADWRAAHRAPEQPAVPEKGMIARMVEEGFAITVKASEALIRRAKERAARDHDAAAAEAAALRGDRQAVDQETGVEPRRPVEGAE